MLMPGRKYQASATSKYRYSINGQEKSDELNENLTTALYWEYDSRIGRRWNVDPVTKVEESPYLTFSGNPILYSDKNGDEANGDKKKPKGKKNTTIDPGHGVIKLSKGKVVSDRGAGSCSTKSPNANLCGTNQVFEGDKALEVSNAIVFWLSLIEDFDVNQTRTEKMKDDSKSDGFKFRYGLANRTNSESLVSIHLNSSENGAQTLPAFSVYQQGKSNQDESIKLGSMIVKSLNGIIPTDNNPAKAANLYTNYVHLAVLNGFDGKAGTLIELGNIKNESFIHKLDANKLQIGFNIANSIHQYHFPDKPAPKIEELTAKFVQMIIIKSFNLAQ